MKVISLTIKNIGKITDTTIQFDKPLLLFYGEIRQGKSTLLNAFRWCCGGEFPDDIIQHGKDEASVEAKCDDGLITRSWYRARDGGTKARAVSFIRNGRAVDKPVQEIKKFLNPFLLDQDHLRRKSELDRKKFFVDLFGVDTSDIDAKLTTSEREASDLRIKIKSYGEIDLTKAESVDVAPLKVQLNDIRGKHAATCTEINEKNRQAIEHNSRRNRGLESVALGKQQIAELETKLADLRTKMAASEKWLQEHPEMTELSLPGAPDTSDLESKIQNAAAQNVRAEQYTRNKARDDARKADEKHLVELERGQREMREQKLAKLKTVSESSGIKGLEFDASGNFVFEGTSAGMISDSQVMRLSSELSALYPEGFGLDLIDRAESLGKSIFEFVDRAKAEKKTILATIVGERPAKVPPEIGVFVVDDGKVTAA